MGGKVISADLVVKDTIKQLLMSALVHEGTSSPPPCQSLSGLMVSLDSDLKSWKLIKPCKHCNPIGWPVKSQFLLWTSTIICILVLVALLYAMEPMIAYQIFFYSTQALVPVLCRGHSSLGCRKHSESQKLQELLSSFLLGPADWLTGPLLTAKIETPW